MKCDLCDEEAVVHMTQVINGNTKKMHLCEDHAIAQGIDIHGSISIPDILMGLGKQNKSFGTNDLTMTCKQCGMAREVFRKTGRLGCPACYKTFMAELMAIVKTIHHSEQHIGKIPTCEGIQTRMKSQLACLQKELKAAIIREEFERAATLRDQIKTYQRKAKGNGS